MHGPQNVKFRLSRHRLCLCPMSDVPNLYYPKNVLFNKAEDLGLEVSSNTRPDVNSGRERQIWDSCKFAKYLPSKNNASLQTTNGLQPITHLAICFDLNSTLLQSIIGQASYGICRTSKINYRHKLANYLRTSPHLNTYWFVFQQ